MSEDFAKKSIELMDEFDDYIVKHPAMHKKIPNRAYIVITVKGDDEFNAASISLIRDPKRKKVIEAHKTDHRWYLRPLKHQAA